MQETHVKFTAKGSVMKQAVQITDSCITQPGPFYFSCSPPLFRDNENCLGISHSNNSLIGRETKS